ncbi:MAG: 50S ribosomal protein L22 [Firmicutes bacterium]|nr:50S ribosomal protein L22 [Bacillota bacterium]
MGTKTNERPGTKAILRSCRMSSYKVREVLNLIRGKSLKQALDILDHLDRQAAVVVAKLVRSAAANAEHNEMLDREELYVAACFADEADTLKRWRPRARGRATRIRKRGCHITVILAKMPEADIARMRAKEAAKAVDLRARRVAGAKKSRNEAELINADTAFAVSEDSATVEQNETNEETVDTDEVVVADSSGDESDAEIEADDESLSETNEETEEEVTEMNEGEH